MPFYIKDKEFGLFIGEFMGLGFYESSIETGECSPLEKPIPFDTKEEAQKFLDSWSGGIPEGTEIIFIGVDTSADNPIKWQDPDKLKAEKFDSRYVCVKSPWFHKLYPEGTDVLGNQDIEEGWEIATVSRKNDDFFWGMFVEGLGLFHCMFPKENVRELTEAERKAWAGRRLGMYGSHTGNLSYGFNLPKEL